jgi:NAD-dependent SIR2 family protein deacetylase
LRASSVSRTHLTAQLFKQQVGDADFFDFLRLQYTGARARRTPSHGAITALPVRELFTTNFDTLLEQAFLERGLAITVSVGPQQFLSRLGTQLQRHLVKLHGTIDQPATHCANPRAVRGVPPRSCRDVQPLAAPAEFVPIRGI